jgi:glyoxylase-like metal-dependent hydrolase (beta-lactamase superfamily II)
VVPVKEVQTYADGERLDVPVNLRAFHTPGHTGGHCSLLAEEAGVLFAGDALTSADFFPGGSGPRVHPFNEDAARAHDSLSRIDGLEAGVVVFGHGQPFSGTPSEAVANARSQG